MTINILRSKREVVQDFYMKFAKDLYKWDLAQYFTPHQVVDFIVSVVNPRFGEHVCDPACGSADFLISAFREVAATGYAECIWGFDNSKQAVQVSVLNMLLNGDGKTNIQENDSLQAYSDESRTFEIVLCNPPFGTKIKEKRFSVLRKFDMGHRWQFDETGTAVSITDKALPSQQAGILFAELCARLADPNNGRIGIILPNGYLGNRSAEYVALREWLLRHCRLVGIVSFPRFTFKKSGADVSASVLFLERRETPLRTASESSGYSTYIGVLESVGWRAGDKIGGPVYLRNQDTGEILLDENNEPRLDSDFPTILDAMLRSSTADCFPWLGRNRQKPGPQTSAIPIERIAQSPFLLMDPKRLCQKYMQLVEQITRMPHLKLGDVLKPVRRKWEKIPSLLYQYVEIQNMGSGDYDFSELRGWQLPGRAKLGAKPGDLFIAGIWGCAGKWFIAGKNIRNMVVTNGCKGFALRQDSMRHLPDLAAGLCSAAFRTQLRALCTGSDGLADLTEEELLEIVIPRIEDSKQREEIDSIVAKFMSADFKMAKAIGEIVAHVENWPAPSPRKSHCAPV